MPDGTPVFCWRMENAHGLYAELLDYGAALRTLFVPDRNGILRDVVQGYDTLDAYRSNGGSFGAAIGRVANRIGGASFVLNGANYPLAQNCGPHHIHGGTIGFSKHVWQGTEEADGVRFTRVSPDGEGTVQEQLLKIHADCYTPNDADCLPTGELAPVAGTAMDFRAFKAIGKDADSDEPCVKPFRGYDVNFCLDGSVPAIEAKSLKSGIVMHVTTDQPGVQLFTANHMKERIGKNGQKYGHRSAFCLETQHFPDCIHHPDWPGCVLRAGEVFDSKTIYSFTTE